MNKSPQPFPAKNVLVGVCGSIAAIAVPPSIIWMRQNLGITSVQVVTTERAIEFVTRTSLIAASGSQAISHWRDAEAEGTNHILLTAPIDLCVIMPATANFLAKIAHGIADDFLTTCVLNLQCPIVAAPAMSEAMWNKPATQRNIRTLESDGIRFVPPSQGFSVTTGVIGDGAMADVVTILTVAASVLEQDK